MNAHPHSDEQTSGANANQDGLSNIRNIVRRGIFGTAVVIAVLMTVGWLLLVHPWSSWNIGFRNGNSEIAFAGRCPGGAHPLSELHLSSEWTSINPNGCRFIYDIKQGSLELSNGEETAQASGWFEFLPTSARITSGPIKGNYAYCSTSTGTQPINWDCEPV